jgi:hypothetical protein
VPVRDWMSKEFILVTEETPVGKVVKSVKKDPAARYLVVRLQRYAVIEIGEGANQLQAELDALADRIGPGLLKMALGDVLGLDRREVPCAKADEPQPAAEDYAVVLEDGRVVGVASRQEAVRDARLELRREIIKIMREDVRREVEQELTELPAVAEPSSADEVPKVVYSVSSVGLPSTLFGERQVFGREGKKGGANARTCPHCGQSFAYYKAKAAKGKVIYTCPKCGAEEPNP